MLRHVQQSSILEAWEYVRIRGHIKILISAKCFGLINSDILLFE